MNDNLPTKRSIEYLCQAMGDMDTVAARNAKRVAQEYIYDTDLSTSIIKLANQIENFLVAIEEKDTEYESDYAAKSSFAREYYIK